MNVRTPILSTAAMLGLGLVVVPIASNAATITLNYNGFNPGETVTIRSGTTPTTVLHTQAANVAGDSASTFAFDLTATGSYIVDLYGNIQTSSTRGSHHIKFDYDHATGQVTTVSAGTDKVLNFAAGTNLTLNTIQVYVDPQGYNPASDPNNGYKVQAEVGNSGRINIGDSLTHANGGKTLTLLNGLQYYAQYNAAQNGHRQNFYLTNGAVPANDGLVNEGATVDNTGGAGTTHQLVRFNKRAITVNTNGLSHSILHSDSQGYALNVLSPSFNGNVDVIAGDVGINNYRLHLPRHAVGDQMNFDVDANGNVVLANTNDHRYVASGSTLSLRTVTVHIDAPTEKESLAYTFNLKSSSTTTNQDILMSAIAGDRDFTLLALNINASLTTYYINGGGHDNDDARDSWRLEYNSVAGTFSLTGWQDAAGTIPLTGLQSYTTLAGYTISIPEPASAVLLGAGLLLACGGRRRRRSY